MNKHIDITATQIGLFIIIGFNKETHRWILQCSLCGHQKLKRGTELRNPNRFMGQCCKGCLEQRKQVPPNTKKCLTCGNTYGLDNFYKVPSHSDGRSSRCKQCYKKTKKVIYEMLSGSKSRARDKGLSHDVTPDFIKTLNEKQGGKCIYTGLDLDWDYNSKGISTPYNPNRASLDRIDSSKGYTQDNVQLVSYIANMIKNQFTEQDFLKTCLLIAKKAIADGKYECEVLGITSQTLEAATTP